jgi:hypothetical protein
MLGDAAAEAGRSSRRRPAADEGAGGGGATRRPRGCRKPEARPKAPTKAPVRRASQGEERPARRRSGARRNAVSTTSYVGSGPSGSGEPSGCADDAGEIPFSGAPAQPPARPREAAVTRA